MEKTKPLVVMAQCNFLKRAFQAMPLGNHNQFHVVKIIGDIFLKVITVLQATALFYLLEGRVWTVQKVRHVDFGVGGHEVKNWCEFRNSTDTVNIVKVNVIGLNNRCLGAGK